MGVFGITTLSVCTQQDLIEVFASTFAPSTDDSVFSNTSTTALPTTYMTQAPQKFSDLCFQSGDNGSNQIPGNQMPWNNDTSSVCKLMKDENDNTDIYCISYDDYTNKYPHISVPKCPISSNTSMPTYTYITPKRGTTMWRIGDFLECLSEKAVMQITSSRLHCQPKSTPSYGLNNTYCWDKPWRRTPPTLSASYPQFFVNRTECIDSIPLTTTTTATSAIEPVAIELTTMMPKEDDSCSACSTMTLAFGAESAAILIAIVGKIIYNQCKKSDVSIAKTPSTSVKKLATLTLSEGLLLGASGIGSGVLVSSLIDPCSPISESTQKAVLASTALYWSNAVTTIISNCITSSTKENNEQNIPLLKASPNCP